MERYYVLAQVAARDGELTELPEELTKLIAQAKRAAKSLRGLLKRSETASKKIEDLTDPLEALRATAESLGDSALYAIR